MKAAHSNETTPPAAALVGIQLPGIDDGEHEGSLAELARLVTTLGYRVVGRLSQRRASGQAARILGEGKLKMLASWTGGSGEAPSPVPRKKSKAALRLEAESTQGLEADESDAEADEPDGAVAEEGDEEEEPTESIRSSSSNVIVVPREKVAVVVFDCELSPSQLRTLERATGAMVLDRTGVIIEIFSRHARTRAARLQVELARLAYVAPRLRESGGASERQGGGVGAKGSGETSLELDRRRIRDRMKELRDELASLGTEHAVRRERRKKEPCVALVGYTNAGKSSLMRALTGSQVLVEDKLFATLDTTVRPLQPETRPKILVSDTVGFIKKLPHDLVASFRSTLDEALNASLLLFVVDASDPAFRSQYEVTRTVLAEVGAGDIPALVLLNKRDLLPPMALEVLQSEFPEALTLSSRDADDLARLRERILRHFESDMVEEDLFLPYKASGLMGEIREAVRVISETHDDAGVSYRVRGKPEDLKRLAERIAGLL